MMLTYFPLLAVLTIGLLLSSSITASDIAFADVIAPNKQLDLDFNPDEIVCKEHLVKVIRTTDNMPICVSPDTVDDLVERALVVAPEPEVVLQVSEQQSKSIGKVTHVATTKQFKNPGEVETFPKINAYNYVFKVCAFEEKIRSPEVIITSDSETKSVKMPRDIKAEDCHTSAVKVKATNPDSISSKLLNHGGVSEAIKEMEDKITSILENLREKRQKLVTILEEPPSSERKKKMSANHQQIADLKLELKNTRAELQKYLLFLSLNSNTNISPVIKNKSITGVDVDGVLSEIISVHEALIQSEQRPENSMTYNVIFEICTSTAPLRIPIVELTSDVGMTTIRMAEKVVTNSCQISTGKINALNSNTISITLAGQTQSSDIIIDLEKKIESLKTQLSEEQKKLALSAVSSSMSKEEREISISESTVKLHELRLELNKAKAELHKILLQVYR